MNKQKNNRLSWKILILILVFSGMLCAALGAALIRKQSGSEQYGSLSAASLPVVSVSYLEGYSEVLHGYTSEMNLSDMRDEIFPLYGSRTVPVTVDPCGNTVKSLQYEIRETGGSLIDSGSISVGSAASFTRELSFSLLMENGSEYQLVLTLSLADREVHYYTRLLYAETQYAAELLQFADEFSGSQYDREKAESFLVSYMNPDPDSPTDDYSYADLRSKYAVLTFGDLQVTKGQDVSLRITELEPTQISLTLSYLVTVEEEDGLRQYEAVEFYCLRYRSGKIYVLDFYRTLTELFDTDTALSEKGRVLLGAGNGEIPILTSDEGTYTAFTVSRELWSYNSTENRLDLIFTFRDSSDLTGRSSLDRHDIRPVRVSEEGDIDYMVYGYMNRGSYEGQVCISFYRYLKSDNATRCLFCMPVTESEQVLMMDLGTLAYVNTEDVCYLRYGDGIFSIDMNSGESVEVSIRAYPGMYAMNDRGNVVVWQEGEDLDYPERLVVLNMDTQSTSVVSAPEGEYIKVLDFIGDDVVYGFGRQSDSVTRANMDTDRLMYRVEIASAAEELLLREVYEEDGILIRSAEVSGTRVVISRCRKEENGGLKDLTDEVLLLTQDSGGNTNRSLVLSRVDDSTQKEYYIQISAVVGSDRNVSSVVPRFEVSGEVNEVAFPYQQTGVYYVYGHGALLAVESELNLAISEAYEVMGVVVDENLNYLWTRGTRDLVKKLSIREYVSEDSTGTLSTSLSILCAQEGIQLTDAGSLLESGLNPVEIIDGALGEGRGVDLTGCSVQELLYFIHQGRPVMAILGDREALVICGYDTTHITVWLPGSGSYEELDITFADEFFEQRGNAFISYR